MKKIKSSMAAMAQLVTPENITGKKRNSADNGQKKRGIFKDIRKAFMPSKKSHPQKVAEIQKEVTVEDIEEQIGNNQLLEASNNLIDLEHKVLQDPLLQDKIEKLESLYKKLERAVFKVVTDSITTDDGDLLSQAVNVIVEQENEDANYVSNKDSTNCSRPKQWKHKWQGYVRLSVTEQINFLSQDTTSFTSGSSSVSHKFITLGKTLKKDLVHVATNLKDHYPEDFDVCNAYLQYFHQFLVAQMDFIMEYELGGEDAHYLLFWVLNFYPNMILKDPILAKHIDESQLIELLTPSTIQNLKTNYIIYEIESVRTYMNRSLDLEMERWKNGKAPEILGNCHHSELHIDIVQIYNGGIKRAGEIDKDTEDRLTCLLHDVMAYFLRRYKTILKEFLDKNKTHPFYSEISIANLNCCCHFREFIEIRHANLPLEHTLSTIHQCEDFIYETLFQEFFLELKTQFRKMSQNSPLCSYQAMQDIVKITESFVSGLTMMCPPCHKDMMARIHIHLVMEYLSRLLKRKVRDKNPLQLQTMANQISENANLINEFCEAYKSEEEWLKPVILKVAEIIRLQDLSAIQLEVATLVEEYPDIRNKQIEAILYMKGNLSSKDIRSILKVSETIERKTSSKPQLFTLLKTS